MRLKILFLTLKDYPERLEKRAVDLVHVSYVLRIPFEVMYGVNGREVTVHETSVPHIFFLQHPVFGTALYNRTTRTNKCQMTPGEFGCAWSHWEIYKRLLIDPDADAYIIFEDDFKQIVDDDTLCAAISNLPQAFDICRINASEWYPYIPREQITSHFATYEKRYSNHTTAYIVSKEGAAKLLLFMAHEISVPADDLISNANLQMPGFRSYVSTPILFQETGDPSLIGKITAGG